MYIQVVVAAQAHSAGYYYRARGLLSRPEAIRHTHYSTAAWHTKTTMLLLRYLGM